MLGLNWNVEDVSMDQLILMGPSLGVVLIAILMWHKSPHPTVRMALSVVVCLELVRIMYWLAVMLMVLNLEH